MVPPNAYLSIVYVTVCYLFMLLLSYPQFHDWLYRIVSNLHYLILILVWECETDWLNTFCYNDMSTFSPDDRMRTQYWPEDMFLMLLDLLQLLAKLYLQKNSDLTEFVKIKPRHPDGVEKKQIWVEKPSSGSPDVNSARSELCRNL